MKQVLNVFCQVCVSLFGYNQVVLRWPLNDFMFQWLQPLFEFWHNLKERKYSREGGQGKREKKEGRGGGREEGEEGWEEGENIGKIGREKDDNFACAAPKREERDKGGGGGDWGGRGSTMPSPHSRPSTSIVIYGPIRQRRWLIVFQLLYFYLYTNFSEKLQIKNGEK